MKPALSHALDALKRGDSLTLASVPDGFDALAVADLARGLSGRSEGRRFSSTWRATGSASRRSRTRFSSSRPRSRFWASRPGIASPMTACRPHAGITAQRMTTLSRLARSRTSEERPRILSTTVNAARAARAPARPHRGRNVFGRAWQRGRSRRDRGLARNQRLLADRDGARHRRIRRARRHHRSLSRPACRTRCGSTSSATRSNRSAPSIPRRSEPSVSCAPSTSCR